MGYDGCKRVFGRYLQWNGAQDVVVGSQDEGHRGLAVGSGGIIVDNLLGWGV